MQSDQYKREFAQFVKDIRKVHSNIAKEDEAARRARKAMVQIFATGAIAAAQSVGHAVGQAKAIIAIALADEPDALVVAAADGVDPDTLKLVKPLIEGTITRQLNNIYEFDDWLQGSCTGNASNRDMARAVYAGDDLASELSDEEDEEHIKPLMPAEHRRLRVKLGLLPGKIAEDELPRAPVHRARPVHRAARRRGREGVAPKDHCAMARPRPADGNARGEGHAHEAAQAARRPDSECTCRIKAPFGLHGMSVPRNAGPMFHPRARNGSALGWRTNWTRFGDSRG